MGPLYIHKKIDQCSNQNQKYNMLRLFELFKENAVLSIILIKYCSRVEKMVEGVKVDL